MLPACPACTALQMYKMKQQVTGMAARDAGVHPPGMLSASAKHLTPPPPPRMQHGVTASYAAQPPQQQQHAASSSMPLMGGPGMPAWASQMGGMGMGMSTPGGPRASMADVDAARQLLQQHMDW